MSRFGSRMSNEDVTDWPELKERPKAEDITVLIAQVDAKVSANDVKADENTTTITELSNTLNALISELKNNGVIK